MEDEYGLDECGYPIHEEKEPDPEFSTFKDGYWRDDED